jgi:hypothetical protein
MATCSIWPTRQITGSPRVQMISSSPRLRQTLAWSARRFLRACGLPEDVSVSAEWRTQEHLPNLSDINLTVTVSRRAEAVSAALAAALEDSLAARSLAVPVVHLGKVG